MKVVPGRKEASAGSEEGVESIVGFEFGGEEEEKSK